MATKKRKTAAERERAAALSRNRIYSVLKAARDDDESKIDIIPASEALQTVTVKAVPNREHIVKVKLTWSNAARPHYIGHFVDKDGNKSQAILSLYNQFDAAQFVVAMNLLADLSAKVKHRSTKR